MLAYNKWEQGVETMQTKHQPTVPREYAGKWIAWDHDITRIVASGNSLVDVLKSAEEAGEPDPVLDKVPRVDVHLIGARIR
jgi:hypothetical protein